MFNAWFCFKWFVDHGNKIRHSDSVVFFAARAPEAPFSLQLFNGSVGEN